MGKGPRRKGAPDAVFAYELLIAKGKGTSATWLKLARAHSDPGPHRNLQKAARAAYMAYKAAGSSLSRAMALGFLATVFDKTRDSSQALMAIREANRLVSREKAAREGAVIGRLARSLDQTRKRIEKRHSFRLRRFRVFSNRPKPSVCLTFSGPLAGRGRVRYRDYIQIDPAARVALNPEGKSLCLEGLAHGRSYKITVLKGMPDRHGLKTPASATVRAAVPDRAPQVAFRNSAYVLPARKAKDLPLSVVNVRTVSLRVYHIVERNLIREIMAGNITRQLYNWKLREFREDTGELLWQGSLDVETRVNRETRTSIPLGEILKDGRPGIYVVSAKAGGVLATQWVVMSDLGLSTVKGRDGLHVFVRSLKSAKPVAGAEVRLIARNNRVLDAVTSDVRGVARFSPGRVRGRGGNAPAAWHLTKILEGVPRPPNRVQNSGATPRAPIALKTGTSYGYRDAWAIGYNKRYTAGVWVGRPDGTPVPGATGRRAAAPLLFKVFEQLPPPSPSLDERAPEGALIADNRGLPPHLRRLRGPGPE